MVKHNEQYGAVRLDDRDSQQECSTASVETRRDDYSISEPQLPLRRRRAIQLGSTVASMTKTRKETAYDEYWAPGVEA